MKKYDIILVDLNPTKGSEQKGVRPCIILQNNIANQSRISTVTIAPLTTNLRETPSGIIILKGNINGLSDTSRIELSQIRTIDKERIIKKIGILEKNYTEELREKLILFFDVYDQFEER